MSRRRFEPGQTPPLNVLEALTLLEHAAGILKMPTADVDYSILTQKIRRGELQNQPGEHCV
jgi:hypothetical protein